MSWGNNRRENSPIQARSQLRDNRSEQQRWADRQARLDVLKDAAAAEALPALLARKDAIAKAYALAYAADYASYKFACSRKGDFLTLDMTRRAERMPSVLDADQSRIGPVRTTTSINLAHVTSIDLTVGKPLRNEPEAWQFQNRAPSGGLAWSSNGIDPEYPVVASVSAEATDFHYAYFPPPRPAESHQGYNGGGMTYYVPQDHPAGPGDRWTIPDFPQEATDDHIRLAGLGATILTPQGLGQAVLDQIMTAIREGYAPNDA
jgi:hypothetical protein